MAKKKAVVKKGKTKAVEKKVARGAVFRGTRKAEGVGRMVERLQDKFPLDKESAGEWLNYARLLKTTSELLERKALDSLGPYPGQPGTVTEIQKRRSKLKTGKEPNTEEDEEGDEE